MAPGPILIFDKSALQALTVDESVWLDHFFLTNVTPVFYFAPYAAFVLTIDLVFYLGMGIGQISAERPSNMIDVAYLYYLPFTMVFVSGDKLHARLAPLFLRENQRFVKAAVLKAGLKQLNEHYAKHKEEIERAGVMTYAHEPPAEVPTIVTTLWDELLRRRDRQTPHGREEARGEVREEAPEEAREGAAAGKTTGGPPSNDELLRRITHIRDSAEHLPESEWPEEPDSVLLEHHVPVRRGSWRLVPEGAEK